MCVSVEREAVHRQNRFSFLFYSRIHQFSAYKQQIMYAIIMSCRFGNINNYVYTLFKTWMSKVIRISKKLISFWSWYTGIILDDKLLLEQNVLNCLMLAPMGFLLPRIADRKVKLPYAFLVGVAVAVVIEGCQLM